MNTIKAIIKDNYSEILYSFGKDLQSAVDTALQKYLIDLITSEIAKLRKKELMFESKYQCDYKSFYQRISEDEEFVANIEANVNKMWEIDLAEWEFCHKGLNDWTKKLQNILMML
ncbi:MAG: hypothetical protein AB7U45_10045 [Desulfamplus sp.]